MIQISIGWCSQLQGAKTSPFSRFFCFFLSLDALVCWLLRFSRSFWSQSCVCLMKKKLSLFFENIHTLWSLCIIISVNTKYSMIAIHSVRSLAIQLNMFVKYHSIRILCVHRTKQLKSDTCDTTLPGKGWGGTQLVFFHKWSYYCKCLNLFFFQMLNLLRWCWHNLSIAFNCNFCLESSNDFLSSRILAHSPGDIILFIPILHFSTPKINHVTS